MKMPKEIVVIIDSEGSKDECLIAYKTIDEGSEFIENGQRVGIYELVSIKTVSKDCKLV